MLVSSSVMEAKARPKDCLRCSELEQRVAELESMVRTLRGQVAKLSAILEEERRANKRQAAPFRKQEQPAAKPKKPGRKSGKRHGRHSHRSAPPQVDETYDVPLPVRCPHCDGEHVRETHVAVQFQTEIPRQLVYRQFDVHMGTCDDCGRNVQGRHALQTSNARGAAASQLGPNVHAALTLLNKQLGLSHGKNVKLLAALFEGLHISRGASARSVQRTASRCRTVYQQVRQDVRSASEVAPDETGCPLRF